MTVTSPKLRQRSTRNSKRAGTSAARSSPRSEAAASPSVESDSEMDRPGDTDTDYDSSVMKAPEQAVLLANETPANKWKSFATRAVYSLLMIFSFLFIVIYLQQPGCAVLVFILQGVMYKELVQLLMREQTERELPGFKLLYLYWFLVCSFMVYGSTLEPHFLMHSLHNKLGFRISHQLQYHRLYAFLLYAFGIVMFVWSLGKRRHFKYQFRQFAYCHVTLVVVVVQSSFLVTNMFNGLIWFLLPCTLIIANDIWAYIFGFLFGRTPLIRLSPKKTWEGFIGGWFATLFWGVVYSRIYSHFPIFTCPRLGFQLEFWPECEPDPMFQYVALSELVGPGVAAVLPNFLQSMQVQPFEEHVFWMGMFASIVAPFGGFFASGFKRAFNIKDFGQSIPGHGGITDRMDCQIMMGMFVYVYYSTRIAQYASNLAHPEVVWRLLGQLSLDDQKLVYTELQRVLQSSGAMP